MNLSEDRILTIINSGYLTLAIVFLGVALIIYSAQRPKNRK